MTDNQNLQEAKGLKAAQPALDTLNAALDAEIAKRDKAKEARDEAERAADENIPGCLMDGDYRMAHAFVNDCQRTQDAYEAARQSVRSIQHAMKVLSDRALGIEE